MGRYSGIGMPKPKKKKVQEPLGALTLRAPPTAGCKSDGTIDLELRSSLLRRGRAPVLQLVDVVQTEARYQACLSARLRAARTRVRTRTHARSVQRKLYSRACGCASSGRACHICVRDNMGLLCGAKAVFRGASHFGVAHIVS